MTKKVDQRTLVSNVFLQPGNLMTRTLQQRNKAVVILVKWIQKATQSTNLSLQSSYSQRYPIIVAPHLTWQLRTPHQVHLNIFRELRLFTSIESALFLDVPSHGKPVPPNLDRLSGSSGLASNYLEEIWPHLTSDLRMKFNDRMLDIMLDSLIVGNSNMSRQRSNSVPTHVKPLHPHPAGPDDIAKHHQLILATQRIAQLERKLYDNQVVLQDTEKENQCLKKDMARLEVQMREMAVDFELRDAQQHKKIEETARKGLEETMEGVVRERDAARGIVSEIQRLSGIVNGNAVGAVPTRNL